MSEIVIKNEVDKVRNRSLGRGWAYSTLTQDVVTALGNPFELVAATNIMNTGFDLNNFIEPRTPQDHRMFNHGGGQFSYTSALYTQLRTTPVTYSTEVYTTPFQVNQTTGAITVGTGTRIWGNLNNTGTTVSTMCWAQSGNYVFNFGDYWGPPNLTYNSGTASAWTVNSNNTVTGASFINYGTVSQYIRSYDNYFVGATRPNNGSTAYFYPNAYVDSPTASYVDLVCAYNGTTLSTVRNTISTSAAATGWPVGEGRTHYYVVGAPQYNAGYNGSSTLGTIRHRLDSSGNARWDIIDNVGNIATTTDVSVTNGVWDIPFYGFSFDMSNGTQLIYLPTGTVLRRSGNTITNVSETADHFEMVQNNFSRNVTPVGPDTWIAMPDYERQMLKFRIDPVTYKITILDGYFMRTVFQGQNYTEAPLWHGCYITGNNNQFLVTTNHHDRGFAPTIRVYKNPMTGVG
jgi:hypothetical protein